MKLEEQRGGNMDIHLLPRKRCKKLKDKDEYIKSCKGIDPALIALDLHVTESFVIIRQRKLGLRKLTSPRDYQKGARHVATETSSTTRKKGMSPL